MYKGQPKLRSKAREPQFEMGMRKGGEKENLLSGLKQRRGEGKGEDQV